MTLINRFVDQLDHARERITHTRVRGQQQLLNTINPSRAASDSVVRSQHQELRTPFQQATGFTSQHLEQLNPVSPFNLSAFSLTSDDERLADEEMNRTLDEQVYEERPVLSEVRPQVVVTCSSDPAAAQAPMGGLVFDMMDEYAAMAALDRIDHVPSHGQQNEAAQLRGENVILIPIHKGKEAEDILKVLRQTPRQPFTMEYPNEPGVDGGGITRQGFEQAFLQVLKNPQGPFSLTQTPNGSEYNLKEDTSQAQAHDLGLLFGRIAISDAAIGHRLSESFIKQLYLSLKVLDKEGISFINKLAKLSNSSVIKLMQDINPNTKNKVNQQYIKSLSSTELKEYFASTVKPYLVMAEAMVQAGMPLSQKEKTFIDQLCGTQDLRGLLKQIPILVNDDLKSLQKPFKGWVDRLLKECTAADVENITRLIFGSAYVTVPPEVCRIQLQKALPDDKGGFKPELFSARTCNQALNVYDKPFEELLKCNDFDVFKGILTTQLNTDFDTG